MAAPMASPPPSSQPTAAPGTVNPSAASPSLHEQLRAQNDDLAALDAELERQAEAARSHRAMRRKPLTALIVFGLIGFGIHASWTDFRYSMGAAAMLDIDLSEMTEYRGPPPPPNTLVSLRAIPLTLKGAKLDDRVLYPLLGSARVMVLATPLEEGSAQGVGADDEEEPGAVFSRRSFRGRAVMFDDWTAAETIRMFFLKTFNHRLGVDLHGQPFPVVVVVDGDLPDSHRWLWGAYAFLVLVAGLNALWLWRSWAALKSAG